MFGALVGMALAFASSQSTAPQAVEVMVLGTYHFANPGRDLNNVKADNILEPRRQAELSTLAEAVAAYKPTKIMVERVAAGSGLQDPHFRTFTPVKLNEERDERYQIGYRLAHMLDLDHVYAIDEQSSEGEPDYFPFGAVAKYAASHGMAERLKQMMEEPAAETKEFEQLQATMSIPELLLRKNDPTGFSSSIGGYYEALAIGGTEQQPGAVLNAMWYMRNAKIFAKLMTVAEPGDRILVVYGSGHNYWLRHFAAETPGYRNVSPAPYLKAAAAKLKR